MEPYRETWSSREGEKTFTVEIGEDGDEAVTRFDGGDLLIESRVRFSECPEGVDFNALRYEKDNEALAAHGFIWLEKDNDEEGRQTSCQGIGGRIRRVFARIRRVFGRIS